MLQAPRMPTTKLNVFGAVRAIQKRHKPHKTHEMITTSQKLKTAIVTKLSTSYECMVTS